MPSLNQLLEELESQDGAGRDRYLSQKLFGGLKDIGRLRDGRNVILYASAYLQKSGAPAPLISLTQEDVHGFMSVMHGMDCSKGLTLILHTPGGMTSATESIVAYLRSKFPYIETIVPTYAMSAGTMIALATDVLVLGRHSQLGPIDPWLFYNDRQVSAQAILDQFANAKEEITDDPRLAHLWAPVLQHLGPSLLQEARYAVDYGKKVVANWLQSYAFRGVPDGTRKADDVAQHFSDASKHLSHGRRIGREEAIDQGLPVLELESDQELQEATLTTYHAANILFERSPIAKVVMAQTGKAWMKANAAARPHTPPKASSPLSGPQR